jgi:hypothetical protein
VDDFLTPAEQTFQGADTFAGIVGYRTVTKVTQAYAGGAGVDRGRHVSVRTDLTTRGVRNSTMGGLATRRDSLPHPIVSPGARLANGRGVPGTLGALALARHDQALVILTCQHVLLGGSAKYGDPVWLTADRDGARRCSRVGRARYGRLGTVQRAGGPVHVDCAVASVDGWSGPVAGWTLEPDSLPEPKQTLAGRVVQVDAGPSGRGFGVVTDVESWDGASDWPGQLLIRAIDSERPFSIEGDSGAVVRDEAGAPVCLLWGTTPGGASIATPIGAVVDILGIQLVRLVRVAALATTDVSR